MHSQRCGRQAGRLTPWPGRGPHLGSRVWEVPAQLHTGTSEELPNQDCLGETAA